MTSAMSTPSRSSLRLANEENLRLAYQRTSALTNLKLDLFGKSLEHGLDRAKGLRAYDQVNDALSTLREESAIRESLQQELARPDGAAHDARVTSLLDELEALRRRERDAYYRDGAKVGDPCIPCLQKAVLDAEIKRLKALPGMTKQKLKKAVKRMKKAIQYADPEVLKVINDRLGTKVNFAALSRFEGGQWTRGYVPPAGRSGVTIGTGFDVGQWRSSELRSKLDLPESIAERLDPYVGLTRDRAVARLQGTPLELTRDEANLVDRGVHQYFVKETMTYWDAHRPPGATAFRDLTSAQQTVLFSRSFHQGIGMPRTTVAREFYGAAQRNDWSAAEEHLRGYKVSQGWYRERVGAEASLLRSERAHHG